MYEKDQKFDIENQIMQKQYNMKLKLWKKEINQKS